VSPKASKRTLSVSLHGRFSKISVFLILGPRPDGTIQARDELDAISAITPELRRYLAAAVQSDERRAAQARNRRLMTGRIHALSTRLAELERATFATEAR
jgi:hypothetical protein